jgi:MraZ protein
LVFSGKFFHTINANGRVSIPSKFRDVLKNVRSEDRVVLLKTPQCVQVFPMEDWCKLFNSLPKKTKTDGLKKRQLSGNSSEVEIDNNGRILLPQDFREYFSTEECVFLGVGAGLFEIWDLEAWRKMDSMQVESAELSPEYEEFEF